MPSLPPRQRLYRYRFRGTVKRPPRRRRKCSQVWSIGGFVQLACLLDNLGARDSKGSRQATEKHIPSTIYLADVSHSSEFASNLHPSRLSEV